MDAAYEIDLKTVTNIKHHFNRILQKVFTPDQKEILLQKIINRLKKQESVTLTDVCVMAYQMYYSPICLASKAVIFVYFNNKIWPFDENDKIIVTDYGDKVKV